MDFSPKLLLSKFTYLGVVFQTKGKLTGHFDNLEGIAAGLCQSGCSHAPIENVTSYTSPFISRCCSSFSHIMDSVRSIHTNETLDFLDEVQGRLIKAWFGVSKYCSTSSLIAAIGWRKASEFHLSTSTERKCILDPLYFQYPFTCPLIRGVIWGFGTATACITSGVVPPHAIPSIIHALQCRLCGERQPTKFHLLSCRTSTLARLIVITPVNVNKLVNVLYVI